VLEKVVEDISFQGCDLDNKRQMIDAAYVRQRLGDVLSKEDLGRFIL
ncbi:MAG: ATP-dependent protease ATPase subunit HslU, partial [Planctomycetota bacterium]